MKSLVVSPEHGARLPRNLSSLGLVMNITVRYFANMRDRMGRAEETISIEGESLTVEDLWSKVSSQQTLPGNLLIAVNMEYTDSSRVLKNGDEVAFFPPVTGG